MDAVLRTLFLDDPYLPEHIHAFCKALPEHQKAEQEYLAVEQEIAERLGRDLFGRFEEVQSHYMAQLVRAYYLFGLGLRRDILSALTGT